MANEDLHRFCHAIPKVELHCHLLGTVRHATFKDLAQAANAPLSDEELDAFYIRGEKPVGVLKALRTLDAFMVRTPDDLHRIAYEYLEDAAAHNVRYAEFFWNPTGTVHKSGMRYDFAQDALVRAIRDAHTDHGIIGRLVPAIDREASPDAALEMIGWITQHRRDEVIGIGIDYSEIDRPPEMFAQAYAAARAVGLKTTAHAGEFGMPWTNVRTAVEMLKVDRIDHGYTIIDAPDYAKQCAEAGIVFTVVPTNSYYLRTLPPERWALDHPIRKMPGLGLRIHPNTDDPALHHVTPTGAWQKMVEDFGFSIADLRGFMLNGLASAWIDESTRTRWRTEFLRDFDSCRQRESRDF
ncbi:adenosine deaminase family protein [Variovorax paradoxus]|uniref:adenosine deaminase family protein n=1 Tax=Variovorax paradoxus TaxID=34073 RepID=UPI0027829E47|nr:adenosine deaminase [Variovorax paradoxus]MDQ0587992.1 adenosine deaminase [Variovorax paradoxus]